MNFLFPILFCLPLFSFAQKADTTSNYFDHDRMESNHHYEKQWGITGSVNAGKYITGTIGIAHARSEQGFEIWGLSAIGANAEIIDPKRKAWGFGAEAWFNGYLSVGIAATDYTDLTLSRFCLRPMLGVGFGNWRFVYGYNFRLNKSDYKIFNTNMITLNYFFPVTHRSIAGLDRKM